LVLPDGGPIAVPEGEENVSEESVEKTEKRDGRKERKMRRKDWSGTGM
jgi:hypothetical protein